MHNIIQHKKAVKDREKGSKNELKMNEECI